MLFVKKKFLKNVNSLLHAYYRHEQYTVLIWNIHHNGAQLPPTIFHQMFTEFGAKVTVFKVNEYWDYKVNIGIIGLTINSIMHLCILCGIAIFMNIYDKNWFYIERWKYWLSIIFINRRGCCYCRVFPLKSSLSWSRYCLNLNATHKL